MLLSCATSFRQLPSAAGQRTTGCHHHHRHHILHNLQALPLVSCSTQVPFTPGCEVAQDCWCFHVKGDMTHSFNPDGWRSCARLSKLETCSPTAHNCFCMHGRNGTEPCLFSDMRAALCTCFPERPEASQRQTRSTLLSEGGRGKPVRDPQSHPCFTARVGARSRSWPSSQRRASRA